MNIFDFEDYRGFLRAYLAQDADGATSKRKALLKSANISSSFLTQVLSEAKQLSAEQAYEIALHIGLTEKETDYFLILVDIGRAGTFKLKERLSLKMKQLQNESQKIASKVSSTLHLTEEQKAMYYSNWIYTAVRNLVPTSTGLSTADIAKKLNIPEPRAENAIQILIDFGLLTKANDGLEYRSGYTHLDSSHPLIFRHHQNWRQRAIQRMDHYTDQHLHYTCPMAISKNAAKQFRVQLLDSIKALNQSLHEEPEVSFCLNIDFFEY